VSKRLGSPYRSGPADCWVKVKNPAAPAVTREADEEWTDGLARLASSNPTMPRARIAKRFQAHRFAAEIDNQWNLEYRLPLSRRTGV
jgi:hypothetical protein